MNPWLKRILGLCLFLILASSATLYWLYQTSSRQLKFVAFQPENNPSMMYVARYLKGGKQFLADSPLGDIRLWNTDTGAIIHTFPMSIYGLFRVPEVSKNENRLLTKELDKVGIWDLSTGKEITTLTRLSHVPKFDYDTRLLTAHFIDQGETVLAIYADYQVLVFDIKTNQVVKQFTADFLKPQTPSTHCLWKLQQERDSTKEEISKEDFLASCNLEESIDSTLDPILSSHGKNLFFANLEKAELEVWNLETKQKMCSFPRILGKTRTGDDGGYFNQFRGGRRGAILSVDEKHLLLYERLYQRKLHWLNLESCQVENQVDLGRRYFDYSFLLENNQILVTGSLYNTRLWNPQTGKIVQPFRENRLFSSGNRLADKWFSEKLFDRIYPDDLLVDFKNKKIITTDREGIYTFDLGNNWKFFE